MFCDRTRNTDTLLLSAGKSDTALTDDGRILFIHFFNEILCLCTVCRSADLIERHYLSLPHLDIFLDRVGKQKYILQYNRNTAAKLF